MKGIIGTTVNSVKSGYIVDWTSLSQMNQKTKKKRALRRRFVYVHIWVREYALSELYHSSDTDLDI